MKKTIFTVCALLAAGAACIAGCSNGQTNQDTRHTQKEPTKITVEEEIGDEKKCPDGEKCPKDGCPEGKLHKGGAHRHGERVKPNFRFEPPAEIAPQEDGAKSGEKQKAPENAKGSFGKKRRFDKRFKDNAPKEKDTPAPEVENDGNPEPEDNENSDK